MSEGALMLRARVDRHRCIGAGNCITIAPTAFDWLPGELLKAGVVDASSVEEELLREAVLACPTRAIVVEEVEDLLPWQLRGKAAPRRVEKTFMFTDIGGSTNLVEALGDEAWQRLLQWHDETLTALFAAHRGEEVVTTGDGFFVGFDSPDDAIACAIAIQRTLAEHRRAHGFAPQVRIGVHASRRDAGRAELPRARACTRRAGSPACRGQRDRREQGDGGGLAVPGVGAPDRDPARDLGAGGRRHGGVALRSRTIAPSVRRTHVWAPTSARIRSISRSASGLDPRNDPDGAEPWASRAARRSFSRARR